MLRPPGLARIASDALARIVGTTDIHGTRIDADDKRRCT